VASLICALSGRSRKCLVLDLDNTLWGGVIGEEGLEGIRLGQGDPESEAFTAFQRYVKGLRDRGVLLATCSKNEDSVAREVFLKHPGMVLQLTDISCFIANWQDKATNLRAIAQQLDIGLDSLVFIDDEPAERALIRRAFPEVVVPEMPDDPAEYIQSLEKHRCFQIVSLAREDLERADYYRANSGRTAAASSSNSLEEFLASLDMVARVAPVEPATLERSAQLISRSNQFNLTTRRHSAAEVRSRMESAEWVTLTVSLADRFGENGLISLLMARGENRDLFIDTWVMSCRVLKRTVEHFLLNQLCALARDKGLLAIHGEYIPTPRNVLVRDHYREMGFAQVSAGPDGRTLWTLSLEENRSPLTTFVKREVSK
jgi:FkbH-like protein